MRSPFGQCVIAFLLTAAFFWWFDKAVIERSNRIACEAILAEEAYQRFQHYVEENDLDYKKIREVSYGADASDDTFVREYLVMAAMCALAIVPYSILLRLIRRFADRLPEAGAEPKHDETPDPEEHPR